MDEKIKQSLQSFESVWQRVEGPSPEREAPEEAEDARLRAFILGEQQRLAAYTRLLRSGRGAVSAALSRPAGEIRERLRRLQLEHFLLTGDTRPPTGAPLGGTGILEQLRWLYLSEEAGGNAYARAAAVSDRSELRLLYARLADESRRHRALLRGLMEKALG